MQKNFNSHFGFSLLELLIVIVIISVLTSIALPIYTHQRIKAQRTDGLISLLELYSKIEQYYSEHSTYLGAENKIKLYSESRAGYYLLNIQNVSATTFTIIATPKTPQAKEDSTCGALSLNELGQRFITGTGKINQCWG